MYFYVTFQPKLNKAGIKVQASLQNRFRSWQVLSVRDVCVSVGQEHNRTSNIYTMLTVCSERRNTKPKVEESVCFLYEQEGTLTD
jgi:hypothetical protein